MKTNALMRLVLSIGGITGCGEQELATRDLDGEELSSEVSFATSEEALSTRGRLAVFVMDNVATKNSVVAFRRASNGALLPSDSFPTGGLGSGGGLGSQNAVILSDGGDWLFVVNAGSNEISVFEVRREFLVLRDIVASGGIRPVSLALHGNLLYALNAGSATVPSTIAGFSVVDGRITAIPDSIRSLSTDGATAPAQIGFNTSGSLLLVTERATNNLTTYLIDADGRPSAPIVTASHGQTPFGFSFHDDILYVSEAFGGAAGASAASSYSISPEGVPAVISGSIPTGQSAACWLNITPNGRYAYTTNTGSDTISGFSIGPGGVIERFDDGGATASPGDGPIDMDFTANGRHLYVLNGQDDSVTALVRRFSGTLEFVEATSGLPASSVGIAAR